MRDSASTLNPTPANLHPSVETWIDYYASGVSAEEGERLQRHLTRCRQCLDLVLDLDAFAEPAPPRTTAADFEQAAVWRAVKGAFEPGTIAWARRWPAAAVVAASVLFAAIGLSAWNERSTRVELESQVAELTRPRPNMVIEDLRPGARERGSSGVETTVDLSADAGTIALILNLEDDVDFPGYEIRVFDTTGEVERVPGMELSDVGNFSLALPAGALAAGSYELRLFGLGRDREQHIETYPIRLH